MRINGKRSGVLYILLFAFISGLVYLFLSILLNGGSWVIQPYNGHIYAEDATATTGKILDRNNNILAETVDGTRTYNSDLNVRSSLLHTVGDSSGYISTSVQSLLRGRLSGYNFITGLNKTPLTDIGFGDVTLTVDSDICSAAYQALSGKNGAVIMYNYLTGEILCKVSTPTYDPENVPSDLETNSAYEGVFVDNTISSTFTPGSTFKIITTICAIENFPDWDTRTYTCDGSLDIGADKITCLSTHGQIDIKTAFMYSCNCYYAQLAIDLGSERLQKTAEELGFNKNFAFNDLETAASTFNVLNAEDVNLGWAGIGQYTDLANPTHMMLIAGAIANSGTFVAPRITQTSIFNLGTDSSQKLMSSNIAQDLKTLMRNNVENYYGDDLFPGLQVCAKTGTAEVGNGKEPTSWMVGFSEDKSTPFAFAVCVVEGGSGLSTANIASTIMKMASDKYKT
jgi:peptidoglycan glycosyltransferase